MKKHYTVERAERIIKPYLEDLEAIVNIDSGTYTKAGVDRVGTHLQQRFQAFGFSTRFDRQQEYGDNLVATHEGGMADGPRILLIGHMDTVFSDGEVARRPFATARRNNMRIATGPGVLDMKSGLLIGMYGLHLLIEAQQAHYQRVTFICNSDEEIGSPGSKPLIEEIAREADAVIVLEPGRAKGTVVSSRKGSGQYRIEAHGVKSHAGVGTIPGVTISAGVIRGGERTNVVPDYAYCDFDVRVADQAGLQAIEAAMSRVALKRVLDGTKIVLSGGMRCMPFERTERSARLVQLAKEAGGELGLTMEDLGSGGASDANTTASMGVPTIDGLGAGGGLAHNPDEYVELDYLPERIALLSGLVQKIGEQGTH
jgi:glutamate carboxypeptidase